MGMCQNLEVARFYKHQKGLKALKQLKDAAHDSGGRVAQAEGSQSVF